MLYTIMLVFVLFVLLFCYFYVKSLVLKALILSPSLSVIQIFLPILYLGEFFLSYCTQLEYFLYCHRITGCM